MPMMSMPINPTPGMENKVWVLFIETSRLDKHRVRPNAVNDGHDPYRRYRLVVQGCKTSPHALPDKDADDGANCGDDDLADDVVSAKSEQAGE